MTPNEQIKHLAEMAVLMAGEHDGRVSALNILRAIDMLREAADKLKDYSHDRWDAEDDG